MASPRNTAQSSSITLWEFGGPFLRLELEPARDEISLTIAPAFTGASQLATDIRPGQSSSRPLFALSRKRVSLFLISSHDFVNFCNTQPLSHAEDFSQRPDAPLVFLWRADGDANPLRQLVTAHWPHNHARPLHRFENTLAVADADQNEIGE